MSTSSRSTNLSSRSSNSRGYYKRRIYPKRKLSLRSQLIRTDNAMHKIVQSGTLSVLVNGVTGFNAFSQSLNFVFNLNTVQYSFAGGAFAAACTFPNAASFGFCFDKWRLDKVVIETIFTSNASATNSLTQLPTMYTVIDTTDTNPLGSNVTALGYGNCQIMQLGNSSGTNNGKQYIYLNNPTIEEDALNTTGTMLTAAGRRSPWLNTDNASIQHNGVKLFIECPGSNNATIGYVQYIFRCFYSFKNVQ